MQDELLESIRSLARTFLAATAPEEPPAWWLELDGNSVKPEVVMEAPKVPPQVRDLYALYSNVCGGFTSMPFPPPDADPDEVRLVRDLYESAQLSKRANAAAFARAKFETELRWRAYYAERLESLT